MSTLIAGSVAERFWPKVDKRSDAECWPWTAYRDAAGYGNFYVSPTKNNAYAHRVAYELMVGPIPEDREIDHLCRNPSCVNPKHMRLATRLDNMRNRRVSLGPGDIRIGMHYSPSRDRWVVQVRQDRKHLYWKAFRTETEARSAMSEVRELHS